VAPPPSPATEPAIPQTPVDHQSIARWGRWSALVAQIPEGSRSIAQVFNPMQSYTIDAVNAAMTLAHPVAAAVQLPTQGAVSFALIAGEAYVKREAEFNTATVKSGQLEITLPKAHFRPNSRSRHHLEALRQCSDKVMSVAMDACNPSRHRATPRYRALYSVKV